MHELETVASPWLAEFSTPQFEARELNGVATVRRANGSVLALFSNEKLNARDPFAKIRAPYRLLENENAIAISPARWWNLQANTTYTSRRRISVVNAVGFDEDFQNRLPVQEVFQTPTRSLILEPSMEFRAGPAHRLVVDYVYDRWAANDTGAGGLALKTRAIDERNLQRNGTLTWYWEPGGRWVSILSAYLGRNRFSRRPSPADPSVEVQGALLLGDPQLENEAHSHSSERYNASWSVLAEDHEIKFGAEARFLRGENISRKNFNPLLSFAGGAAPLLDGDLNIVGRRLTLIDSLERFRRTALLLRAGLPDEEILARGGGASLFSISGGDPFARLRQWEYSAYVQDVWQLRPWVLLSLGARFQTQTGVRNDRAFGPRFGLSWGLPGGGSSPRQVIRLGAGLFHEGFSEDLRLNTIRYNGLNQRVFVVQRPGAVLLPSFPQLLEGNATASCSAATQGCGYPASLMPRRGGNVVGALTGTSQPRSACRTAVASSGISAPTQSKKERPPGPFRHPSTTFTSTRPMAASGCTIFSSGAAAEDASRGRRSTTTRGLSAIRMDLPRFPPTAGTSPRSTGGRPPISVIPHTFPR